MNKYIFLVLFALSYIAKCFAQQVKVETDWEYTKFKNSVCLCVDNRIIITTTNIKLSELTVTTNNGTISGSDQGNRGIYYLNPDSMKSTFIEVKQKLPSGKLKLLAKKELTVIYPERRNASFLGKTHGTMAGAQAKVCSGLRTSADEFDFDDVRTYLSGYTMVVKRQGNIIYYHATTLPSLMRGSCNIDGPDRDFLQNLQYGDSLIFKDIGLSFCDKKVFTSDSTIRLYID